MPSCLVPCQESDSSSSSSSSDSEGGEDHGEGTGGAAPSAAPPLPAPLPAPEPELQPSEDSQGAIARDLFNEEFSNPQTPCQDSLGDRPPYLLRHAISMGFALIAMHSYQWVLP